MMRSSVRRTMAALALCGALACGASATADTLVTDFDNYVPNSTYEAWSDGNVTSITSGPASLTVESLDFGGAFKDIVPNVDGSGETHIELEVTVNSGAPGAIIALGDTGFTEFNYAWYGLPAGDHTLTMPLSTPTYIGVAGDDSMLDLANLDFIHTQVDAGGAFAYNISFNNLRLVTPIPEPATLGLLACGAGLVVLRRRR